MAMNSLTEMAPDPSVSYLTNSSSGESYRCKRHEIRAKIQHSRDRSWRTLDVKADTVLPSSSSFSSCSLAYRAIVASSSLASLSAPKRSRSSLRAAAAVGASLLVGDGDEATGESLLPSPPSAMRLVDGRRLRRSSPMTHPTDVFLETPFGRMHQLIPVAAG